MKHLVYLLFFSLSLAFTACSEEDKIYVEPEVPETPQQPDSPAPDENGNDNDNTNGDQSSLRIRIIIGDNEITATLHDNATARDFVSQLPFTVTLEDYASTEKIFYMPNGYSLSTAGAPAGFDPSAGDITLYAPWGNIAIFYRDYGYSNGLVPVGRIDGDGISLLQVLGNITATFEIM